MFKQFLLNENRSYLGQKLGDILTALQSLHEDGPNLNSRQVSQACKGIVNQIKRILHDSWPDSSLPTLKSLQRVGVALAKTIDSNGDPHDILDAAVQELQKSSSQLKMPINDLAANDEPDGDD